jgi:lipopolysaccharide export LptBFGC system permease protein LptF
VIAGRLDRYVLRRFLVFYGLSLLYLAGLFLLADLVLRLERFLDAAGGLSASGRTVAGAVLSFYAATIPLVVLQVAPFVTVMAACMAVVDLRRWNELYPMQEAGRSVPRILAPVLAFSVLVTGLLVAAQDRVAPRAVEARLRVERAMESEKDRSVGRVPHVRDSAGNVWTLSRWDPAAMAAEGVRAVPFRDGTRTWDSLEVPRMRFARGRDGRQGWYPEGGRLHAPAEAPGPVEAAEVARDRPLPTDLSPADVDLVRASEDLEGLSTSRLRRLRDRTPDLHYLTVLLHRRVTVPLSNLVLVLVGVPVVLRGRGSSLFLSVLAAMSICAAFFVADTVACDLGGRGVLPPGVATWLATILFGAAGVAMMDASSAPGAGR